MRLVGAPSMQHLRHGGNMWQYVGNIRLDELDCDTKHNVDYSSRNDELDSRLRIKLNTTTNAKDKDYITKLLNMKIESIEDLVDKEWLFNGGFLRTDEELFDHNLYGKMNPRVPKLEGYDEDYYRTLLCYIPFGIYIPVLVFSMFSGNGFGAAFAFPIPLFLTLFMYIRKERIIIKRYDKHNIKNEDYYKHKAKIIGAHYVGFSFISGTLKESAKSIKELEECKNTEI